jgi:arylsulfatase A-like enzyme
MLKHNLRTENVEAKEDRRMTNRPRLILVVVAVAAAWFPAQARPADTPDRRPNILYIMSDDHAAHAMSCYGSRVNQTPNLDRIARQGVRFDNCFCTNSLCGPCRAVVLTGKYSHRNGFIDNNSVFDGSQQTVAKLLQKAGYQTAMVGKWHLVSEPTGFDYWHILIGQGPYYNPPMKTPEGIVSHTGYTTDIITDQALDFLKNKRDKGKPFFLMYHHKAPHRNWQPGPKYLDKYQGVTLPEPDNLFDDWSGRGTAAHAQEMTVARHLTPHDLKLVPQKELNAEQAAAWNNAYEAENKAFEAAHLQGDDLVRWKYQRYMKDYLRCIDSVDENVGRVLDYLDQSGLSENTVVIYTSDQGFFLGDHGWFDKRFMYEESLRAPLVVRWPGRVRPGTVNRDIVLNLDFAETFLEISRTAVPKDMQGRSLVPVLEGKTPADWRKSMYYRYYEYPGPHMVQKHYGVRNDRYKLIDFFEVGQWELYDLQKDPREMKSVYADPAYAGVVGELKAELKRLKDLYKDDGTLPAKKPARKPAGKPKPKAKVKPEPK